MSNEWTAKLLREFLVTQVIRRVVAPWASPPKERAARGGLVASQLVGLVMARYVLRLEPLASATPECARRRDRAHRAALSHRRRAFPGVRRSARQAGELAALRDQPAVESQIR